MNAPTIFNFGSSPIRTTTSSEGKPLFVAKDVAVALGYKDTINAIKAHTKGVVIRHPLQTPGGVQDVAVIDESNLYRLVMRSNAEHAEEFQDWVVEEVLPAIREHGVYATAPKIEDMLADPTSMIKALEALQKSRLEAKQAKLEAEASKKVAIESQQATMNISIKKKESDAKLEKQEPWVEAAKALIGKKKGLLVDQVAKVLIQEGYPVTVKKVRELCVEKGLIFKGAKKKEATANAVKRGLAINIPKDFNNHKTGFSGTNFQAHITTAGVAFFIKNLAKWGYAKLEEDVSIRIEDIHFLDDL